MRRLNRKPATNVVSHNHYSKLLHLAPPAVLPPSVDLRAHCSPIKNQGDQSSCTSFACVGSVEFLQNVLLANKIQNQLVMSPNGFVPLSEDFIYANERIKEDDFDQDGGATLSTGAQVVEQIGVCCETSWPYSDDTLYTKPSDAAFSEAAQHKVFTAYQVDNLFQMKHSLAQGFPFVFGIACYDSLMSEAVAESGIVPMPAPGETPVGGHALMCCGYSDATQMFLFRNSWGTSWGVSGYGWLPYNYMNNQNLAEDMWSFRYS